MIEAPVLLSAKDKRARRELIQRVRTQIHTHADLERILHMIPDETKRRQFFECVKPFLKFKVEWGAAPAEEENVSQNQ